MIDVLVVLTVFLLLTFQASPTCGCIQKPMDLPVSQSTTDLMDAPLINVSSNGEVVVDGIVVVTRGEVDLRVGRIEALFNQLKMKHELAKQLRPDAEPPSHVILAIDSDTPAGLVKSVVTTAAKSGYPQVDFMVVKKGG